jgi:hypothetical protein
MTLSLKEAKLELLSKYKDILEWPTPESGITILFRLMSKSELDVFNTLCIKEEVTYEAENFILDNIILYPPKEVLDDKLLEGEVKQLVPVVVQASGFMGVDDFLNELNLQRHMVTSMMGQMMAFISRAFPTYTVTDLENMNYKQLARLIALSESLMQVKFDIPDLTQTPKNILEKGQEAKAKLTPEQIMEARKRAEDIIREHHASTK